MRRARAALACVVALTPALGAARAEVLRVGPEEALKAPSDAARVAKDGDTIEIAAGEYFDCAVWRQSGITITGPQGGGEAAVLTDRTCQGKAIFVIPGHGVTVRHLTFTRARVPDGNGAGIRAEGRDLVVAHSRFVNNESAILSASQPEGTILVLDSAFERNGSWQGAYCNATLEIGGQRALRVERSAFGPVRGCDAVRVRDVRVAEVLDSRFADGPGPAARHMVVAEAGSGLVVRGSHFARGPQAEGAAVVLRDVAGAGPGAEVRDSVLENAGGRRLVLLHSIAAAPAVVAGNRVAPGDVELDSSGYWLARARAAARWGIDTARGIAGMAKRAVLRLLPG